MDKTECIAAEYLRSLGFVDIEYQPNGNITPDFLADGRIAIEVRRLNQNVIKPPERQKDLKRRLFRFGSV